MCVCFVNTVVWLVVFVNYYNEFISCSGIVSFLLVTCQILHVYVHSVSQDLEQKQQDLDALVMRLQSLEDVCCVFYKNCY